MSSIEQQAKGKKDGEIRYLTPLNIETNKTKKYCRFKKSGIKYIDYKDPDFLLKLVRTTIPEIITKARVVTTPWFAPNPKPIEIAKNK